MSKVVNSILGFAIGDAMGVPIEFTLRKDLINNPVVSMKGYGTYDVPEGTWSDDTALTLATMDSIINVHGIDYEDMIKRFCDFVNSSEYTATGEVFDIGITTKQALMNYYNNHERPTKCGLSGVNNNGNGSLMRMLPIALYTFYELTDDEQVLDIVKKASSLTHAHEFSIMGCFIYVKYVHFLLSGFDKFEALEKVRELNYYKFSEDARRCYKRFLSTDFYKLDLDYIKSTGYVVDTLEAVIWTFLNTNSFMKAIVGSINLGGDTDTIGAITGSLAGLYYGINEDLLNKLQNKDYILDLSEKFDEEIRLNILKFDEEIGDKFGIIKGNEKIFFIKTGANGSIYGFQNKYIKIAKTINYKYGLTVIVSANNEAVKTLENDFNVLSNYINENSEIYFMGHSNGAILGIQTEYKNEQIKRMLLINCPLMINLHKTKEGIKEYHGDLTFVYGSKDPSASYIPLIQTFKRIKVEVARGQDHNFSKGSEFLNLPEKYLFYDFKKVS